jgi:hypothetical protein
VSDGGGRSESPHGGADSWLEHNLDEGIDRGRRVGRRHPGQTGAGGERQDGVPTGEEGGNLVQLPEGATFGTETRLSPQQREELARRAARIEDEMLDLHPDQEPVQPPEDGERT